MKDYFSVGENNEMGRAMIDMDNILDEAVRWIRDKLSPGDVFEDSALAEWAEDNGYSLNDD